MTQQSELLQVDTDRLKALSANWREKSRVALQYAGPGSGFGMMALIYGECADQLDAILAGQNSVTARSPSTIPQGWRPLKESR